MCFLKGVVLPFFWPQRQQVWFLTWPRMDLFGLLSLSRALLLCQLGEPRQGRTTGRGKKGARCFWQPRGLDQLRLGEAFTLGLYSYARMGKISALEGIAGLQVRPCSCPCGVPSCCKGGYWSWADLFCVLQKLCNFCSPLLNILWAGWTTAVSEGIGRGISICQCSTWAPKVLLWRCDGFGCMILYTGTGTLAQLKVH